MTPISFENKVLLAPLTKGGNLPFRRLCVAWGADGTVSEMAYARFLNRGEARERALLRKHPTEQFFGVQLAVIDPAEAIPAALQAVGQGASFIDINCGCPIHDTTRRGLGASVLQKPNKLGELVQALSQAIPVPVTVKIRLGWSEQEMNYLRIARKIEECGAKALFVHGRTREQRYSRAADWKRIGEIRQAVSIPVIGNGDILTHYEAEERKKISGVHALLLARGALIKPWLFTEIKEGKTLNLSWRERVQIYFQLASYMKDHFRNDEKGRRRIMSFLPWHFTFFHRYRYLPEERFSLTSREHPLLQTRIENTTDIPESDVPPEELLLRSQNLELHTLLASALIDAESLSDALRGVTALSSDARVQSISELPEDEVFSAG